MSVFCSAKLSIYLVFFYVQLNTLPEISGVVSRIIFIKRYITSRCNWNFGKKKHKIKSLRFVLMQNFDIKQSKRFQELDSDKKIRWHTEICQLCMPDCPENGARFGASFQ